jgi:hypothetical protein
VISRTRTKIPQICLTKFYHFRFHLSLDALTTTKQNSVSRVTACSLLQMGGGEMSTDKLLANCIQITPTQPLIARTYTITSWGARMLNLRAAHKQYADYPTTLGLLLIRMIKNGVKLFHTYEEVCAFTGNVIS